MKKLAMDGSGWTDAKLGGYRGSRPLEGPSAGLRALGTYLARKLQLASSERSCRRRKTRLTCWLRERPFGQPSTTTRLSQYNLCALAEPCSATTARAMSSRATASAHAMSRPSDCHPGRSRHAFHLLPTRNAISVPKLASEKALESVNWEGAGIGREGMGDCYGSTWTVLCQMLGLVWYRRF